MWISRETDTVILYRLNKKGELPICEKLSYIEELLSSSQIIEVEYNSMKRINYKNISESSIQILEKRWNIIKDIVLCEPDIYFGEERGSLINKVIIEYGCAKKTVYEYLRLYWENGKMKYALLPNIYKRGGKGKDKIPGDKKRGRPLKYTIVTQVTENYDNLNNSITQSGINITDEIKQKIEKGFKKFYANQNKITYVQAYQKTLERYFVRGYYTNENGDKIPIIDMDNIPSITQFKYWGNKLFTLKELNILREGERKNELQKRAVLGETTIESFAPGRRFQIDATIADIYLVSRLNSNYIIGRPVVYMVIDVFSRMIVGFYVGVEGPSWMGAMMALYNTTRNKVELCKEFGVNIQEEAWECSYLPDSLTVDRGEMESKKPLNLVQNLGVRIDILPPYRADWKGIVEQNFRRINNKTLHWLEGTVKSEFRIRGEKDYRLGASLNLEEFTKIIIYSILYFNNRYMDYYNRDEQMIRDNVNSTPKNLWKWGIQNRSGLLKSYPEDIIKFNLMPSTSCSISYKGLMFQKRKYSSSEAVSSGIFERAKQKGRIKVKISYDPRNMDYIYVHTNDGFTKYNLVDNSKKFLYYEEIACINEIEEQEKEYYKKIDIQNTAELNESIDIIAKQAKDRFEDAKESKSKRIKNININRKMEKELNRDEEAWELEKKESNVAKVISINDDIDEDEYVPAPQYSNLLKFDLDKEK
ncbi:Mu transposase C-terminal domain-containing protein [Clostridium sp. BSD9I1]|uniref:Mu transposase C-terminal domain-containing protein n=1 Tax=Clostridium sp. BSD9I1 TaxID=2003589 RepID=UPI001645A456|nr:Mu transposase C-terminal domain-containing protein [Clostridium sp. BSD9I1]